MECLYCWLKCIKSCNFKLDFSSAKITKVYEGDLMKCKISSRGVQFEYKEDHYSFPYEIEKMAEHFKIAYQD